MWVANAKSNRVLRLEPGSGRVTAEVPVGRTPLRLAGLKGRIWSTDWGDGTVSAVSVSPPRRAATIHVGPEPEGIVALGNDLWVVSERNGSLARIAPQQRRPTERIHVGYQPRQVTAAGGHLWVSVFGDDSVVEVDPSTRRVIARIRACAGPQGLAYAAGQLWVACTTSGELVAVDPQSRRVVRRISYEAADAVTHAGPVLRVTSDNGPSTGVLEPATAKVSRTVHLSDAFISDANSDVVAADGAIWVSSPDEGTVYRIGGP